MDLGSALGEGKLGIFKYMDMFEKMSDDEKFILFLLWGAFAKGEGKCPGRDEKAFMENENIAIINEESR